MWLLPQQPKGPPHGRLHNHFCLDPSPTPSPHHYLHLSVQSITCPQCLHSSPVLALGVVSCGNGSRASYVRGAATPLRTRGVTQLNSSFIAAADDTDGSWMSHPAFALDVGFVQTTRICFCCAWCSGRSDQALTNRSTDITECIHISQEQIRFRTFFSFSCHLSDLLCHFFCHIPLLHSIAGTVYCTC